MKNKSLLKTFLAAIIVVAMGISLWSFSKDQKNFEIAKNLDIYFTLFRELNLFYVDEIEPGDLVVKSIDEMLESLDPYTVYIPESEMEDFKFMTTGEYAGIGALISKQGKKIVISEPYEGFPAQKNGLRAGDVFIEVAGKKTEELSVSDVSDLLKGPANQPVRIKVKRPGEKKLVSVEIVREKIQINPVPYYGMIDDKTGYIRLANFTANCSDKVKEALLDLRDKQGAEKLVFDLRSNPGGLLIEAVKVTNFFVNHGQEIVSTKGKVTRWDKTYRATSQPLDSIIPLVVLVNSSSASASEIVAGALQDLDRAVVIGKRTFGKGLVQTTRDLSYNSKLKVTTAKYYIPSGRCIQALDYSHRNDDGSVGKLPDSLITEFSTRNGRKVYDGGGIAPDISVGRQTPGNITISLLRKFMVFDFATQWRNKHESILPPEEFKISAEIFSEFKQYLKDNDFEYESNSEKSLNELIETAKKERYFEDAELEFEALKKDLSHDLDKDLELFNDEINRLLLDEIVSRYYYQKGAIKSALINDKEVKKAIEILNKPEEIQTLLTVHEQ
jgi:carboxyl-terminal processing protease